MPLDVQQMRKRADDMQRPLGMDLGMGVQVSLRELALLWAELGELRAHVEALQRAYEHHGHGHPLSPEKP